MKTFRPFNLNDYIKVKLTEMGLKIHRARYDSLWAIGQQPFFEYQPPTIDENGWSEWQAWEFMQIFGAHFSNGFNNPCIIKIYFEERE